MRHGCEEHELAAGNFTHAAAQPVAVEDLLSRASRRPGARDHEPRHSSLLARIMPLPHDPSTKAPRRHAGTVLPGNDRRKRWLPSPAPSVGARPAEITADAYAAASCDRCYTTAASKTDSAHRDGETQRQRYARGARARGKTGDLRQKRRQRLTRWRRCRPQMARARQTDNYIKRYAAAGTFASVVKVGLLATSCWTKCVQDHVNALPQYVQYRHLNLCPPFPFQF